MVYVTMECNMLSHPDFKEKQIILVLLSHGDKLSFKNDNIIVSDENKKIKLQSSCYRIFSLFVVGHLTITTGLLQRAKKFGFSIVWMSHSLKPYSHWNTSAEGNVLLRKRQYNYNSQAIAQKLVQNKIGNQIEVLRKIRNKNSELKKDIQHLTKYYNDLNSVIKEPKRILGLEGMASKIYFQALFKEYQWIARRPRTKIDITNCLLDIGYTILFNFIESLLNLYGFDIYQGVYHKLFYQRKSLVCDLVEPFRPLIDSRIRKAYRLNQIKSSDFSVVQNQYMIFGKKSLPYLQLFINELIENKEDLFKYVQSYYRAFINNRSIEKYPYFNIFEKTYKVAC